MSKLTHDPKGVAHIAHLIANVLEVTEQYVEGDGWTCMSEVWVAIDGWSADIHPQVG